MISTAEEFLRGKPFSIESIHSNMIQFAKLHVEAALKDASQKVKTKQGWWQDNNIPFGTSYTEVDKESILNAYSLTNIK
jgi:hypothetical protein